MTPTITLTTDFGMRDSYVAQIKGVLLRAGPAALRILDLTHEIAPQNVREAAFFLRCALPRFAPGTIHLAVIDPGVGGARRPIAAEYGGQFLVGPDNGVFGWLLGPSARVHAIDARRLRLGEPAATFHGRDVFAPAAALLARGDALSALGDALIDPVRLPWPEPRAERGQARGEIVHIDRFGNLITNLERRHLPAAEGCVVALGERVIGAIHGHYAQAAPGEALALFGSEGLLEIAVRDGSAAAQSGACVGDPVSISASGPVRA